MASCKTQVVSFFQISNNREQEFLADSTACQSAIVRPTLRRGLREYQVYGLPARRFSLSEKNIEQPGQYQHFVFAEHWTVQIH